MKKFFICLIVLVLFGCSKNIEETKQKPVEDKCYTPYYKGMDLLIFGVEIEGHQYIIYNGYREGNIIHAAHCPCHDKIK